MNYGFKQNPSPVPWDAALYRADGLETFSVENGPQSGSEGFAQLNCLILRGHPRVRTVVEARCPAGNETSPAKTQLDALRSDTVLECGGYGTRKRRP